MKHIIAFGFGILCAAGVASAQEIDPTVEVSREYEGKLIESHKPAYRMAVPDSVEKFDLQFDYSVFASPYKGTDVFKPYMLDLRPDVHDYTGNRLLLRAGAGYSLHPVADIVWSPKLKGPFRMNVYGHHRSYVGNYRSIAPDASGRLVRDGKSRYFGYETETSAGTDGRLDWNGGYISYDFGYYGVAVEDRYVRRHYDAAKADLRVASMTSEERYFLYDVKLAYAYGKDVYSAGNVVENGITLDAVLGPVLSREHGIFMDVGLDVAVYDGNISGYAGDFSIVPHYVLNRGRWNLDLGVKLAVLLSNGSEYMNDMTGQFVYPAINVGFEAIRSYLDIYLKVDGGENINRYSDLISRNRHYGAHWTDRTLMDNTVERVNASLGFKGNIASRFDYDLRGGYVYMGNDMTDAVRYAKVGNETVFMPGVCWQDYQMVYAALDCGWHSEDFRLGASFLYRHTNINFNMPRFAADVDAVYNWKKRIYVGLHCEAATGRDGVAFPVDEKQLLVQVKLPGWVDLGLSAEYRFTRRLSFWLYGGNLLNMTVQRTPMFAESGISCTLGVTFTL